MMPMIFTGKVMHSRLFPRANKFVYRIYYLFFPLDDLSRLPLSVNKFAKTSFYTEDHGNKQRGRDLKVWIQDILSTYNISADGPIILMCMPRILGYVFNPVSFWFCYDEDKNLRAVLCEVNNTFGETHSYLCRRNDFEPISGHEWIEGEKVFHVSPFMERNGTYRFRFNLQNDKIGIWIDHYTPEGKKLLLTSLTGNLVPMTQKQVDRCFWSYPFVTIKAIILIHWQALKLVMKGIKYIPKPAQLAERLSEVFRRNDITHL